MNFGAEPPWSRAEVLSRVAAGWRDGFRGALPGVPHADDHYCFSVDQNKSPGTYRHNYERFRDTIKNTWTIEEVDLHSDLADLNKLSEAERHLVNRLVAFFATGDTIVANNLVLNLYEQVNAPEARLYLSRQLFEEAVHVQFYLTLLDTYLPHENDRVEAFAAVETTRRSAPRPSSATGGSTRSRR